MPSARDFVITELQKRGHRPQISHDFGWRIWARCERCHQEGYADANVRGEYIDSSARGSVFDTDCTARDRRRHTGGTGWLRAWQR
jgi:hypothetical protein